MSKLGRVAETVAGKTKQLVAEVVGDGKLSDEGKRQVKRAEEKARGEQVQEADKSNISTIANNLT